MALTRQGDAGVMWLHIPVIAMSQPHHVMVQPCLIADEGSAEERLPDRKRLDLKRSTCIIRMQSDATKPKGKKV